jgi:transcriptional regulator with XRE-family HTH domain
MAKKKGKEPLRLNRLRVILADKEISQTEFGQLINVDRVKINKMCNNRTQPTILLLYKMAQALDVDVTDLLTPISTLREYFPSANSKK